ncbi:MAG: FtsX-like permease family protein [Gammaproteobacteria bacterium]|nr:FtsX-like permease family protein [Gammaproteobacteria bacterium]
MFAQVFEVTEMNLKNLPNRFGSSSVIVVGIGGVVGVLVAILAMASGFQSTLDRGGDPQRAVVLRGGSDNELSSFMNTETINVVASMPGIVEASPELYMVADVPKRSTGTDANLIVRGVSPDAFTLHDEVVIVEGRRFVPGRGEIIAGRGAHVEFAGIDIGNSVKLRQSEWTIVGIFEADGSAYESELWVDLPVAQSAFRLDGGASSMRLRLDSPERVDELAERIESDPRLDLELFGEVEFFARQGGGLTNTIRTFGYAVAVIMAIGAVFAALNTMYAAVVSRTVEIATLRALGFGAFPVVVSVMIESMALALLGGVLGAAVSYFGFNGYTVSTLSNASFSQIAFDFAVTPELLRDGLVWALSLGAIGGLLPAVRAAVLPITVALRGE